MSGLSSSRRRYGLALGLLALGLLFSVTLGVCSGSSRIPLRKILEILFTSGGEAAQRSIVWKVRMPRVLLAATLGGGLAVSGFLLQTFFHNPIAGPFVLGISSGAKMTVAAAMVFLVHRFQGASSAVLVGAAFIGALLSTGVILLLSRQVRQMSVLLVAGIMIGYLCSAGTELIIAFAADADIVNLHNWSQGSFSGADMEGVRFSLWLTGLTVGVVFLLSKPIGAFQLGESYAKSVGVNVRGIRVAVILLSSLLSACVAAFAGPISFVGVAIPFLVKRLLQTSRPLQVTPALFLAGAIACVAADWIARTCLAPAELNVSTVTSILFAPVVLLMMLKKRERV